VGQPPRQPGTPLARTRSGLSTSRTTSTSTSRRFPRDSQPHRHRLSAGVSELITPVTLLHGRSYINSEIIAMGVPAQGFTAWYVVTRAQKEEKSSSTLPCQSWGCGVYPLHVPSLIWETPCAVFRYRNPIGEVVRFFKLRHDGAFRIYNCCPELPCVDNPPFHARTPCCFSHVFCSDSESEGNHVLL
jgi:hypothetical protein